MSGPRADFASLGAALFRLTRLQRELYAGWAVFWVILATALLWGVVTFGIHAGWGRRVGWWMLVLVALSGAAAARAQIRRDWPSRLGVARRIDAAQRLDNVVVSAWILHQRPELCGNEVVRGTLSAQALPATRDFERAFEGPRRRLELMVALAVLLLLLLILIWFFFPRTVASAVSAVPGTRQPDKERPGSTPGAGAASPEEKQAVASSSGDSAEEAAGSSADEGNSSSRADLDNAASRLQELSGQYSDIDQAEEIQGPKAALEEALQDPSAESLRQAADALDEAARTAAKNRSATSTNNGKQAAEDLSKELGQMAEDLRKAADQGQGQGAAKGPGQGGAGVGGREAGSGAGGNHEGGTRSANEVPQEADHELTRRMPGEERIPDPGPEPDPGDPERSQEQTLTDPNDPDIVLDEDFERRLDALRAAGKESKHGNH